MLLVTKKNVWKTQHKIYSIKIKNKKKSQAKRNIKEELETKKKQLLSKRNPIIASHIKIQV